MDFNGVTMRKSVGHNQGPIEQPRIGNRFTRPEIIGQHGRWMQNGNLPSLVLLVALATHASTVHLFVHEAALDDAAFSQKG